MTWNNPDKVQRYIARLQQHVEQLARQNNKLAAYHKSIGEKVCTLQFQILEHAGLLLFRFFPTPLYNDAFWSFSFQSAVWDEISDFHSHYKVFMKI